MNLVRRDVILEPVWTDRTQSGSNDHSLNVPLHQEMGNAKSRCELASETLSLTKHSQILTELKLAELPELDQILP